MPAEALGGAAIVKLLGIILGPLLALFAAAFGFMWKKQDQAIKDNRTDQVALRNELYRDFATREHVEMYVALVIKPVIESVDRLAESNKELAHELREQRKTQ